MRYTIVRNDDRTRRTFAEDVSGARTIAHLVEMMAGGLTCTIIDNSTGKSVPVWEEDAF